MYGARICRICLRQLTDDQHYYYLSNDNELQLESKLLDFMPEMDLRVLPDPMVCHRCMSIIEEIHEFKQLCQQTEHVLKNVWKKETPCEFTLKEEYVEPTPVIDEFYYCHTCSYCTDDKTDLRRHLRLHRRLFECDVCDYKSKKRISMANHRRVHFKAKTHGCNVCDYRSAYESNLKRHLARHLGDRHKPKHPAVLRCNVCDYSASGMTGLRRHLNNHKGAKLFSCDLCDYKANEKNSIIVHLRTHTGEKPFKCDRCDYRSTQTSNLKRHLRMHHRHNS